MNTVMISPLHSSSPHASVARRVILVSVSYLWIFFIIRHQSCLRCISKHAPLGIRVCITSLPEFECKQHGKHNKYVECTVKGSCSVALWDQQDRWTDLCLGFNTYLCWCVLLSQVHPVLLLPPPCFEQRLPACLFG